MEFAAISEPRFPILLHAGGCKEDSCETQAKACALSHPFQLEARLVLQKKESDDNTVAAYLNLVDQFEKLRAKKFVTGRPITNPTLIRGIFFDAFSGNREAFTLLETAHWPKQIRNQFNKAFLQLDALKQFCDFSDSPTALEAKTSASFYPFAGVIAWADGKSISVSIDRQLPENDIQVAWPLVLSTPPLTTFFSRVGIRTKVVLFSGGTPIGTVQAVRNESTSEVELYNVPPKIRARIISIGRERGSVAVANRDSLRDPDQWTTIQLSSPKAKELFNSIQPKPEKNGLERRAYYSKHLRSYLVCIKAKDGSNLWFEIDGSLKTKGLEVGFEPLVAADFFNRGRSQWLGRTQDGKIKSLDL